jgi:hypothetical protein
LDALEAATALSEKRRALVKTLLDVDAMVQHKGWIGNAARVWREGVVKLGKSRTAQNDSNQSEAP